MEHEREWAKREAAGIGERVAYFRHQAGLSAQELAERCSALGFPALSRVVIAKLETAKREAVSTAELKVLAEALGVPPVLLLFPVGRSDAVEVLPGWQDAPWVAYQWFIGRADLAWPGTLPQMGDSSPVVLWGEHLRMEAAIEEMDDYRVSTMATGTYVDPRTAGITVPPGIFGENIEVLTISLRRIRQRMREAGMTPPSLQPETIRIIGKEV